MYDARHWASATYARPTVPMRTGSGIALCSISNVVRKVTAFKLGGQCGPG